MAGREVSPGEGQPPHPGRLPRGGEGGDGLHRLPPRLLAFAREMRLRPAPAEQKLWFCLRDRRLNGLKFRRQTVIGPYIADFCCAEHRLIIEVDGDSHADRERYDQRRTTWMDKGGYRVLRFTNQEVAGSLDGVLLGIVRQCGLEAGETSRSAE